MIRLQRALMHIAANKAYNACHHDGALDACRKAVPVTPDLSRAQSLLQADQPLHDNGALEGENGARGSLAEEPRGCNLDEQAAAANAAGTADIASDMIGCVCIRGSSGIGSQDHRVDLPEGVAVGGAGAKGKWEERWGQQRMDVRK
jgi:hypothetical protein